MTEMCPDARCIMGVVTIRKILHGLARHANLFQGSKKLLSCHDFRHSRATRRADWGEAKLRLYHGWSRMSDMPSRYVRTHIDDLRTQVLQDAGITPRDPDKVGGSPSGMKDCPMCAEEIKAAAWRCKHCRELRLAPRNA
jgi:hypothetical protein